MTGEKLKHNLSRFVVTVWVLAVLILTTSYTATLTSMMTVQQIRFNSNTDFVGHLSGSIIANASLTGPRLRATNTKGLNTSQDYAEALLNKTVAFIVDELPYLNVLLGEKPAQFIMVKSQCTTNGFGFVCIPLFFDLTLHVPFYLLTKYVLFRCFRRVMSWCTMCPQR